MTGFTLDQSRKAHIFLCQGGCPQPCLTRRTVQQGDPAKHGATGTRKGTTGGFGEKQKVTSKKNPLVNVYITMERSTIFNG